METRAGDSDDVFRRFNEPNFQFPVTETYLRPSSDQYPVEGSPFPQTPFVVNSHLNQTLEIEAALSRLNISYCPYTRFNNYGFLFGNRESDLGFGGNEGLSRFGRFSNAVSSSCGGGGGSSACSANHGYFGLKKDQNPNLMGSVFVPDLNQSGLIYDLPNDYIGMRDETMILTNLNNAPSLYDLRIQQDVGKISLRDLRGQIVSLAIDQYGSRLLQMKFERISGDEIDMVFVEVIDKVVELMMDQFGNYLIQKLVEVCSEEQRSMILLSVTKTESQFVGLCLNTHGTRAVQKLLKFLTNSQQISLLMSSITHGAVRLMKDLNGHHVIKHCLKDFPYEDTKHLLKEIADNCLDIATHKCGCCVLPTCLESSRGEHKERLVSDIIANAMILAEDRYGNYIVQYLLGLKIERVTAHLLRRFEGRYFSLSGNKYGSNVVEKCLTESTEEQSRLIIIELLRSPNISLLLNDPFGNYVFQSALTVSKGIVHNALVKLVEIHSLSMRNNLHGKKVLSWFEKKKACNMYRNIKKR